MGKNYYHNEFGGEYSPRHITAIGPLHYHYMNKASSAQPPQLFPQVPTIQKFEINTQPTHEASGPVLKKR